MNRAQIIDGYGKLKDLNKYIRYLKWLKYLLHPVAWLMLGFVWGHHVGYDHGYIKGVAWVIERSHTTLGPKITEPHYAPTPKHDM